MGSNQQQSVARVSMSHVECVCLVITPKLAYLIDVNRIIRLIQGCGRRVSRHFNRNIKSPTN